MIRETFQVGMLGCNCSILADEHAREAVVIDPGDDVEAIMQRLKALQLKVKAIVHTHAHIDHVGATAALARNTGAPTYLHNGDKLLHDMLHVQAQVLGIPEPERGPMDHALVDEGVISFGTYELGVIHTPGHTPGSVCFNVVGHDLCFSGDTLFRSSVGRTDLWGGDSTELMKSIRNKLYSLNSAVEVVPGHGPNTTIDRERRTNPFVRA